MRNEKDLERASDANIRVITENELIYFETFIAHMGTAGRYHDISSWQNFYKDRISQISLT